MTRKVTERGTRRTLEPWQREDAARLLAIWEAKKPMSQQAFGNEYEIGNQGAVWQYLNGKIALNLDAALRFASGLGVSVSDFSPTLARRLQAAIAGTKRDHFTLIDRYRIGLSAGPGNDHDEIEDTSNDQIAFREEWLRSKGWSPRALKAVYADGNSMQPRIQSGDVLLVDTASREFHENSVYALKHAGRLRVKRLRMRYDGALRLCSDNPSPEFQDDEVVPADKFDLVEIIGRVVWVGGSV